MTKLYLYILVLIMCLPFPAVAQETALSKIRMSSNKTTAQIYIALNSMPKYTEVHKGKRIDIILDTKLSNTEPVNFQTDDKIVKFLTQEGENGTILSFFTRYEPQSVKISTTENTTLIVDILLGNQFTKTYPELSAKLQGVSIVSEKTKDFNNPYITSPYSGNWRSFFSHYEPEVLTSAPINYTAPPFPIIDFLPDGFKSDLLPLEVLQLSAENRWNEIVPIMMEQVTTTIDPGVKKHFALVLGEVLLRAHMDNDAFKQLYLLKDQYADDFVGIAAHYLLARLHAERGDTFKADFQFRQLDKKIHQDFALSPFILLAQIETALVTGQLDRTQVLLDRDDVALPQRLVKIRKLRQADYWYANKSYVKALVGYQLLEDESLIGQYPLSLNGYCNTLYYQKKYPEAAHCFDSLSSMITGQEYLGMISLKKAMAELHFKSYKEMYVTFSSIEDTYYGSVAGARAALKKTDIRYLSKPSFRKTSVNTYHRLADEGIERTVAEEAALKEAVAYFELEDPTKSIDLLMQFQRNYHQSPLKSTAQALLIEQLPGQIEKLLKDDKYVDAIVLAKQNREFFVNNWIDISLLGMLAKAYHELGIYDEARKLYLFLLSTSSPEKQESYYLPLLTILHGEGYHDLVEDYATQYTYNYPTGKDKDQIMLIRLKSLVADGKNRQALDLLNGDTPPLPQIEKLAASLYFGSNQFDKTITLLLPYLDSNQLKVDDYIYMLAESLFQDNQSSRAEQLFLDIKNNEKFHDQACYRLAMITRQNGNKEESLKLLSEIVEKGNDPLWQKLAQKDLEFQQLMIQ
jgi:hypothetical protein